jgi:hypothetical protein
MQFILSLKTHDKTIEISVPEWKDKENFFYASVPKWLDQFDVATVLYIDKEQKIIVFHDILQEVFAYLIGDLSKVLGKKLELPSTISEKEMGKEFHYDSHLNQDKVECSNYWLFSNKGIANTWIYSIGNNICFEISPSYKWLFQDPEPQEPFVDFQTFMKNYKPYAFFCIDESTARQWLEQCIPLAKKLKIRTSLDKE